MRTVKLQDLGSELEGAQAELKAFRPSDLPDLPLFDLKEQIVDFGARGPVITKQLDRLKVNILDLGRMLMDPSAARSLASQIDGYEMQLFEYASKVLPEDWADERRKFMVALMELMIQYYPPYVWDELDDEMRAWVAEGLEMDSIDVTSADKEMMTRIQCVDSAHQSLARIGIMGYRLGVFQRSSDRDLPQQRIRIKAPVGLDDRLEVVDLVCHFHGSARLTQPLRHMIDLMRADQKAAFKSELSQIKEGATARFLDALKCANAVSWFHLVDEEFDLREGGVGVKPGGYIRINIEKGWVYPAGAIGRIARTRKWRALMADVNTPRIHVDSIGEDKFDPKGGPKLDEDTFANTRYWHMILNRAYQAQGKVEKVSAGGKVHKDAATITIDEWLHPSAMSPGTAFAQLARLNIGATVYNRIEVLLERHSEDRKIRVVWCNEEAAGLFKSCIDFQDEDEIQKPFRIFLDSLHRSLDLPDLTA